jgi:hypothetical protein
MNIDSAGTPGTAQIEPVSALSGLQPQTAIAVAIDTAYVASVGGGGITEGIYMFDNRINNGTTGEGSLELHTHCNVQDLLGFEVYPINSASSTGDTVEITGFNVSQGSVFGSQGYPMEQTSNYWIGQATTAGTQTYQIRVLVTIGGIRPTKYNVYWDPFITAA